MSVKIKGLTNLKNVIISSSVPNPPATTSVWTVFGDQPGVMFPIVDGTGGTNTPISGFYIKTYIAGIFDVNADLANLNTADVRYGCKYVGGATGGTAEIIVSGVVVRTITLSSPAIQLECWTETSFSDYLPVLNGNTGWVDYGEMAFNGFSGVVFDYVERVSFDTKDVKYAWYVDTNTGLTPGQVLETAPIFIDGVTMYTAPNPLETFDWTAVTQEDGTGNTMFDVPTSINLNVNLGGYAPSWTDISGISNINYGIYYDLGYPSSQAAISVDGGNYWPATPGDPEVYISTGEVFAFPVDSPNYVQIDAVSDGTGVDNAGIRTYPGIASSSYGGFIEAANRGLPILYEQWYSKTAAGSPPVGPTPPPTANAVEWTEVLNTGVTNWSTYFGYQNNCIMWTGSEFIALGRGSRTPIDTTLYLTTLTSPDGLTWKGKLYYVEMLPYYWESICIGNGTYVAVGGADDVLTSNGSRDEFGDLIWTYINNSIAPMSMNAVCFGDNKFVAVGASSNGSSAYNIMISGDGIAWLGIQTASDIVFNTVCYSSVLGKFVAGGMKFDGSGALYTSTDGTTWVPQTSAMTECTSLTATDTGVIGVGVTVNNPSTIRTVDGTTWEHFYSDDVTSARACCYASIPDVIISVGDNTAQVTPTGEAWTLSTVLPNVAHNPLVVCYSPTLNMCVATPLVAPGLFMIAPLNSYVP